MGAKLVKSENLCCQLVVFTRLSLLKDFSPRCVSNATLSELINNFHQAIDRVISELGKREKISLWFCQILNIIVDRYKPKTEGCWIKENIDLLRQFGYQNDRHTLITTVSTLLTNFN